MKRSHKFLTCALLCYGPIAAYAQSGLVITAFHHNGQLSWNNYSNSSEYATQYRIEWASSLSGPWTNSWASLDGISATGQSYTVSVPMFYRLVATVTNHPGDAYENDDTFGEARPISNGVPQDHSIHEPSDQDYVTIDCPGNSEGRCDIMIEVQSGTGDMAFHLYDSTYTELPDLGGMGIWMDIPEGTHYVMVEEEGNDSTVDSYTLTVTTQTAPE